MNQRTIDHRTYRNVLWIDPAVKDYHVFVDSVNEYTLALVYPEPLRFEVERIGFVFEKHGPMATYLQEHVTLLVDSGVKHMDFLACETLPEWQPYYDQLIGIRVGASNNQTGNFQYGGDWLMESTSEDVERVYFTSAIEHYRYLLAPSVTEAIFVNGILIIVGTELLNSTISTLVRVTNTATALSFTNYKSGNVIITHSNGTTTNKAVTIGTVIQSTGNELARVKGFTTLGVSPNLYINTTSGSNRDVYTDTNNFLTFNIASNSNEFSGKTRVFFGYLKPTETSNHTFNITGPNRGIDDGARFRIGQAGTSLYSFMMNLGNAIVDMSGTYNNTPFSVTTQANLTRGELYPFIVGFIDTGVGAAQLTCNLSTGLNRALLPMTPFCVMNDNTNTPGMYRYSFANTTAMGADRTAINNNRVAIVRDMPSLYTRPSYILGSTEDRHVLLENNTFTYYGVDISSVPLNISGYKESNTTKGDYTLIGSGIDSNTVLYINGNTASPALNTTTFAFSFAEIITSLYLNSNYIYSKNFSNSSTITTIGPLRGVGSQQITVEGYDLRYLKSVTLFGQNAPIQNTSTNTSLVFSIPIGNNPLNSSVKVTYLSNISYVYEFISDNVSSTTFYPVCAPQRSTIALLGANLSNLSAIYFGNASTSWIWNSSVNLSVVVPVGTTNCSIGIWDIYGNNTSYGLNFTYANPYNYEVRIDEQSNIEGLVGSYVYFYGLNLIRISRVTFGDKEAVFEILSNYHIRATVPDIQTSSKITLLTPYASYEASLFTPIFPSLYQTNASGKINQTLVFQGENLDIVSVQFSKASRLRTFSIPTSVDATILSSTASQVEIRIPYGLEPQTIYLDDIHQNSLTVDFQYILPEPVRVDTRDTSGITQDANRILYSWIYSRVDYPTGSYSGRIDQAVVDTQTIYISNRTTQITRFRIDSRVTLRPFVTPTPVEYIFLDRLLYMVSGTMLYVCDISRGTIRPYQMPRTYTGLAVWKNTLYGTDGTTLYEVTLDPVSDISFSIIGVHGKVKQILVVNDRLFILSDNLVQYSLYGDVEFTLEQSYTCMAYSYTSLLLSNNHWIDQIPLPPMIPSEFRWISCNQTKGTSNTLITMKGERLDKIAYIHFDSSPAFIRLTTPTTLLFQVPKGNRSPKIELLDQMYNRLPHSFVFEYQNTEFTLSLPREGRYGTHLYLFGENLDQVEEVYLGHFRLNPVLIRKNTLRVIAPDSTGVQQITLIDRDKNVISPGLTFSYVTVESSICFPAHTLVYSDQGAVEIQKLIPGKHTIYGKDIVAITSTQYIEDTMVSFEPGSMGVHLPEKVTVMTNKHKVFVHGKMVEARRLLGRPGISSIPYEGYRVYNVLLTTEGRMNVQGLLCETLDPANPMAALFTPQDCPV